jgi:hypothetical protein
MALSVYEISIPVLVRGLGILSALLHKGEKHAAAGGIDPKSLVAARLAPDMLSLAGQVQRAGDTAKLSASRLTGTQAPAFTDDETTFEDLQARIDRTVAFLTGIEEASFTDAESREINLGSGDAARHLTGSSYVLTFVLPNFFFHVTTAYDILRHNGVSIGKRDYLWPSVEQPGQ